MWLISYCVLSIYTTFLVSSCVLVGIHDVSCPPQRPVFFLVDMHDSSCPPQRYGVLPSRYTRRFVCSEQRVGNLITYFVRHSRRGVKSLLISNCVLVDIHDVSCHPQRSGTGLVDIHDVSYPPQRSGSFLVDIHNVSCALKSASKT